MTGYHLFHTRSSKDLSSVFRISMHTPKWNASILKVNKSNIVLQIHTMMTAIKGTMTNTMNTIS